MTTIMAVLLAICVAAVWLGAAALLRLRTLTRVHAFAFVNVVAGGALAVAAALADGPSPRTAKVLLIRFVLLRSGAVSSQVTGRAIHVCGGERR